MEEELNIYMALENKLQDYCDDHRLGYMLQLDTWPMRMIIWHAGPKGQGPGQMGMEQEACSQQPPKCTWTMEADEIILAPENGFRLSKKEMDKLTGFIKKLELAWLRVCFRRNLEEQHASI